MEDVDKDDDDEEKAEGSTVKEGLKNTPFSQRELSSSASRSPEESSCIIALEPRERTFSIVFVTTKLTVCVGCDEWTAEERVYRRKSGLSSVNFLSWGGLLL